MTGERTKRSALDSLGRYRRSLASLGMTLVGLTCTRPQPPEPVVITFPPYDTTTIRPSPPRRGAEPPAATQPADAPLPPRDGVRDVGDTTIRVLLSAGLSTATLTTPGTAILSDRAGDFLTQGVNGASWQVERLGRRVRAIRTNGGATPWVDAIYARSSDAALLNTNGKPYRGDLQFTASDSGISVVNIVRIDDYLRGVVPLEIGSRALGDSAAVQAQAITARSYAYIHLAPELARAYDVTSGTQDQVYGGAAVETEVSSRAVESTRTLVLRYAGRVVNAPYSSTCGGQTAAASEIWRSNDEPYLQRVSDEIPGTGRYYCDIAPRFRWTRTIEGPQLTAALAQYLASYASVAGGRPGVAQNVAVATRTPSGRVGTLLITTDRGTYTLRGNDVRYVLRPPGGEILNSTYFSVVATPGANGVAKVTLTGMGYGHGVGMCQWGAIGRARAGQDYRTILRTYYPGTTIGPAN